MHCENVLSNAVFECNYEYLILVGLSGPILEGKGMRTIFQKKGKKGQNIRQFEQKCTMYKVWKYFEKRTASGVRLSHASNS